MLGNLLCAPSAGHSFGLLGVAMSFIVNRRDVDFLMYEILNLDELLASERYQDHDRETVAAVLDLAQQMAEEEFLPCAAEHD